jgi:hypothetical protein
MNSINLNITSKVVEAKVRPIKASWTREMVSDLNFATEIDIDNIFKAHYRKEKINKIFDKTW